jgi:SAM-dependent methyltransferase
MADYLNHMKDYWNNRFSSKNQIWGGAPSTTASHALAVFRSKNVCEILVPGAGYGRNSRMFSDAGLAVTGIEIADEAVAIARQHDPRTVVYCASFLDLPLAAAAYDAIYCFNLLHLFRENERRLFINKCRTVLRNNGLAFFVVFSDGEKSFGKGTQVEENTFESKPGRPVHYFNEQDLLDHFVGFTVLETGLAEDYENHGEEGPHTHLVRYIIAEKTSTNGRLSTTLQSGINIRTNCSMPGRRLTTIIMINHAEGRDRLAAQNHLQI